MILQTPRTKSRSFNRESLEEDWCEEGRIRKKSAGHEGEDDHLTVLGENVQVLMVTTREKEGEGEEEGESRKGG